MVTSFLVFATPGGGNRTPCRDRAVWEAQIRSECLGFIIAATYTVNSRVGRAGGGGGGIFATRVRPKSKKRKHVMLNGGKRKVKHEKKRKTASCWRDGEKVCTCEHEHEHDMHMHMCMQNIANQNIAHTLAVREEPLHVTPTQRTARVGRDVGSKHFLCPFPGPRAVSG